MIVNGRPYTNENGFVDDELLTNWSKYPVFERRKISDWIKKNIRPNKRKVCSCSSYGLKHELQRDTGIYLTNNQFKDAMWLAGYYPVDPDELNWHYNIEFVSDFNPNPFLTWITQFEGDNFYGEFVHDCLCDKRFPVFAERQVLEDYITERTCSYIPYLEAFELLWEGYKRHLIALRGTTISEEVTDNEDN